MVTGDGRRKQRQRWEQGRFALVRPKDLSAAARKPCTAAPSASTLRST